MCTVQIFSTPPHHFKAMSLRRPLGAGRQAESILQGLGRGEEPPIAGVRLRGQLDFTSSQRSSPTLVDIFVLACKKLI